MRDKTKSVFPGFPVNFRKPLRWKSFPLPPIDADDMIFTGCDFISSFKSSLRSVVADNIDNQTDQYPPKCNKLPNLLSGVDKKCRPV